MSLTQAEQIATRQELRANFDLAGVTLAQAAQDLQTTPAHVAAVLELNVATIEEPWILRNYLNQQMIAAGQTPLPYSRLNGSPRRHWFLNQCRIQRGVLGE